MKLKIKRLDPRAIVPKKAHPTDACFDINILIDFDRNLPKSLSNIGETLTHTVSYAVEGDEVNTERRMVTIEPHCSVVFHTGLSCEVEKGYSLKIHVRSSTGIKNALALSNGTGVIDADYRGELMVALTNQSNEPRTIYDLDRVVQGEICKVEEYEIEEVDELSDTERGTGGIGSTGKN